jgi:hypothetical protein
MPCTQIQLPDSDNSITTVKMWMRLRRSHENPPLGVAGHAKQVTASGRPQRTLLSV